MKSIEKICLIPYKDSFKIKLKKNCPNIQTNNRTLALYSQLLQHFSQTSLIIDMSTGIDHYNNIYSLSQKFPSAQELQIHPHYFNPEILKGLYWLKRLTFSFDNLYKVRSWDDIINFFNNRFPQLEALQNYPVDVIINRISPDHPSLEDFIRKMEDLINLLPNFQALQSLTPEHRTTISDKDLLRLIPQKCHTVLDFSRMPLISAKGLLEVIKKSPHASLMWDNSESLYQDILEEKLSIEECIPLIIALQNHQSPLLQPEFTNIKQKMTDQEILKLLEANKIPSSRSLDLSNMSLISKLTFVKLVKAIKPQRLTLNHTPNLYSAIHSIARDIQTLNLPFEALKEMGFFRFSLSISSKRRMSKKLLSLILNHPT